MLLTFNILLACEHLMQATTLTELAVLKTVSKRKAMLESVLIFSVRNNCKSECVQVIKWPYTFRKKSWLVTIFKIVVTYPVILVNKIIELAYRSLLFQYALMERVVSPLVLSLIKE